MLRRTSGIQRLADGLLETLWLSRWYIIALFLLFAVTGFLLRIASTPPTQSTESVILKVPSGSGAAEIAEQLRANDLIRSKTAFLIVRHVGYEGRPFVAGTYRFRKDMVMVKVLEYLVDGIVATERVTIPEGFTIQQIAARLEEKGITESEPLARMAGAGAREFDIDSPTGSLEGYLFPDTYEFALGSDPEVVIRKMLSVLDQRITEPLAEDIAAGNRSLHEILTIASLVEREARVAGERELVASVIYNRLELNMPLQIDATILYAQGQHKSRVLFEDLKVQSPYNTYTHRGLPPGPIANAGKAAIEAAIRPAETNYLYYVAAPDGSHLFARTFDEHRANIRRVRSQ